MTLYRLLIFLPLMSLLPSGLYDDTFLPLQFGGLWSTESDAAAYGGSYKSGTGSLSFEVMGDGFIIYGTRFASGGSAEVCADDICTTISWANGVTVYQSPIITMDGLGNGLHAITVTANNDGNITIDAIYIYPGIPEVNTPQPEATQEAWIVESDDSSLRFEYRVTVGDVAIVLTSVATLIMVVFITGIGIQWWLDS